MPIKPKSKDDDIDLTKPDNDSVKTVNIHDEPNPLPPASKTETRLFQKVPGEKVWLTKQQAIDQGFYWRVEEDEKKH